MTIRIDTVLWIAFAIMSAMVFTIGYVDKDLNYPTSLFIAGSIDTLIAAILLLRSGVSLALPLVIAIYVFANKWFLFFLFLTIIFVRGG